MTRIASTTLRDLANQLSTDGSLDRGEVDKLVDTALEDQSLSVDERAELAEILSRYADKIDSPETKERLSAFMRISDAEVRALAHKLERDDGVIDAADADKLIATMDGAGRFAKNRAFSLGAVMVGAKMTPEAKEKIQAAVERVGAADVLTSLGDVEGETLVVATDGRLGLGAPPADVAEELRAVIRYTVTVPEGTDPFAGVTDPAALAKIGSGLLGACARFAPEPGLEGADKLERRQGRAAALMLLESAAVRAGELSDPALRDRLCNQLIAAAAAEPFRSLRDFAFQSYDLKAEAGTFPKNDEAREAVFPSTPPYDKWLQDNIVKIHYVCDNDGTPITGTVGYFRRMGFQVTQREDKSYDCTYPPGHDHPGIDVHIPAPPPEHGEPSLFDKMDDESVDMIVYSGHAGYGRRVDHALRQGIESDGEGKLVILMQCWGEGNLESLENAFPGAQVLSTTDSTTDHIDHIMFTKLLNGILDKDGWDSMGDAIRAELKEQLGGSSHYEGKDWDRQFFFPNTRELMLNNFDRDRDAISDRRDPVFNVVYPRIPGLSGGYDPVVQPAPDYALDGTAFKQSLDTVSLIFRYEHMLPPEMAERVPWSPEAIGSTGFYTPERGDLSAFRFEILDGRLVVGVSSRYAHTNEEDLTRMLAVEAGLFLGKEAGLDDAGQVALGLAMLDRAIQQQGDWYGEEGILDLQSVEESMLFSRYGMKGANLEAVRKAAALDDHGHYTPEVFQRVVDHVAGVVGLAGAAGATPSRVGDVKEVPEGLSFRESDLTVETVQPVIEQIVPGATATSFEPQWLPQGAPCSVRVMVRDAEGATAVLSLGLDDRGKITAASSIPVEIQGLIDGQVKAWIQEVASQHDLDQTTLTAVFREALASGLDNGQAMVELFKSVRRQIEPGSEIWAYPENMYQYLSPEEREIAELGYAQLLGWGGLNAERDLFSWAETLSMDLPEAKKAYTDTLLERGLGPAIAELLERLPDDAGLPPWAFVNRAQNDWGLPAELVREAIPVLQRKTGQRPAGMVLRGIEESAWEEEGKAKIRGIGEPLIEAGASAVEVAKAVLEGYAAEFGSPPDFWGWQWLGEVGLVTEAEAQELHDLYESLWN